MARVHRGDARASRETTAGYWRRYLQQIARRGTEHGSGWAASAGVVERACAWPQNLRRLRTRYGLPPRFADA
jgi:hypothetical protein